MKAKILNAKQENQMVNIMPIEQLHQKQKMIQPKRQEIINLQGVKLYKNQVETGKNGLKLFDSLSSGRNRSNNPSIISSKSLENMHQKLSHLYKNYSVNDISKIKNFSNYAVEKYEDFNQKSQDYHKISNSFIKWKKKAQQIQKVKTNNNIQYSQSMIIYSVYSQDQN
ncbi:unnamed protein product [Paramecium pentaurelia]|uniref:Uncharacterized protein n=1 Tax=Paramecium pentaurelia TaxID=43138 RepID=A0A8S1V6H2_9CILI|nr:unnamed protein product [Paramecium pentaurelia]CAD8172430.1 unnamed protein product [Paramecium pentaurelia]